jgi:DNA-binding transcriptional MocR family regulator
LWLELPAAVGSFALSQMALQQQIVIAPGILFSSQKQYTRHIQLNSAGGWGEKCNKQ